MWLAFSHDTKQNLTLIHDGQDPLAATLDVLKRKLQLHVVEVIGKLRKKASHASNEQLLSLVRAKYVNLKAISRQSILKIYIFLSSFCFCLYLTRYISLILEISFSRDTWLRLAAAQQQLQIIKLTDIKMQLIRIIKKE